jgi:RecJ-like exonuclease
MTSLICPNCNGNGYLRLNWETEESIKQCGVCNSSGELDENKHYKQTWDGDKYKGIVTKTLYFGPPLDPQYFTNYKIHKS